jgi:hypothetical protein
MSSRRPFRETKKREEGENKHTDFQMVEWVEKGRKTGVSDKQQLQQMKEKQKQKRMLGAWSKRLFCLELRYLDLEQRSKESCYRNFIAKEAESNPREWEQRQPPSWAAEQAPDSS